MYCGALGKISGCLVHISAAGNRQCLQPAAEIGVRVCHDRLPSPYAMMSRQSFSLFRARMLLPASAILCTLMRPSLFPDQRILRKKMPFRRSMLRSADSCCSVFVRHVHNHIPGNVPVQHPRKDLDGGLEFLRDHLIAPRATRSSTPSDISCEQ